MFQDLEYLFEFIDDLPVGIARNDTTGKTPNHFNKFFYSMFGWAESDIDTMEKWFSNAYPDEVYRTHVIQTWQKMIDDTESENKTYSYPIEVKVACKDGSFKWCKARYYRKQNFIYGIFTDLSVQKEHEEHLNQTIESFRALELRKNLALKAGTIGFWEWNYASNTLLWDDTMYRIYGIDAATDAASPYTMWSNAVDPKDKPHAEENLNNAKEHNGEYNTKFWITTPSGGRKYIHAIGINEFDSNGQAIRMVGINTDITEAKLREIKLAEEKRERDVQYQRYKSLVETVPDFVYEYSTAKGTKFHSSNVLDFFKITEEEYKANPMVWYNSIHEDDRPLVQEAIEKFKKGDHFDIEYRIKNGQGELRWFRDRSFSRHDTADETIIMGIAVDITASKDIELELEKRVTQEIEKNKKNFELMVQQSKQAMIGEVLNNIAHHWRQPLTVIDLQLQELEYDYQNGELDDVLLKEIINTSRGEIHFLSNTIDKFRQFFLPYKTAEKIDMKKIFESALALLELDFKRQAIQVNIEEKKPLSIFGLHSDINQVILALLNNAKDAIVRTKNKGVITITIDANSFSIADNGSGIHKDDIDRIFNPYFSTKFSGKGIGLSLFMVKGIIENKFNGRISVHNNPSGAVFTVTFS